MASRSYKRSGPSGYEPCCGVAGICGLDGVQQALFDLSHRMTIAFAEGVVMSDTDRSDLTSDDWTNIHAKAWSDPKFRDLLETDPTKAIHEWAKERGRKIQRIVDLSDWISVKKAHYTAPSCC
jgi:hypothetical protein